jgi:hypothetical protein
MPWQEALAALTENGIAIGFDAATEGVAAVIQSRDEETLQKLVDEFVRLAREDAKNKGRNDPLQEHDYRGHQVYEVKDGGFAAIGSTLVLVNKKDLGTRLVDQLMDGGKSTLGGNERFALAGNERFAEARKSMPADAAMWGWIDIQTAREAEAAKGKPFTKQTDNPVAELLIGGLLDTLQHTPWLTGSLSLKTEGIGLSLAMPHDPEWVTESREYFYGPDGTGAAPPVPDLDGLVFSVSSYRNLSELWLRAGDLFEQNVADKLAEADSNLSLYFGGKDFGEQVLGSFEPGVQFLAGRQEFAEGQPQPEIRLPAFALVLQMKDPETLRRELKRTFQSAIGFLNVIGAMNGQPQLELDMATEGGVELAISRYIPGADDGDGKPARINFNFSPSVAFAGNRFILSSTEGFARQLGAAPTGSDNAPANTAMAIEFPALGTVLEDNKSQLITQNMLEEGHTREEAERQIGILLEIVGVFRDASARLSTTGGRVSLDLQLRLLEGNGK